MQTIGPYRITGELGRGGLGVVLSAIDSRNAQPVALKLLLNAGAADSTARRRFVREAQALSKLSHPGIVGVRDAGEHQGLPYLVMDLVEGESLAHRLQRGGWLEERQVARLGRELALALEHAHQAGLVHRDLKPQNVLLGKDGRARLVDFGLVRDLDPDRSRLSHTGLFLGTPGFWPPEQALGQVERIGPHSDVYGLGATLYAALTGKPPFEAETAAGHVQAVEHDAPRSLSAHRPEVDRALASIVLRCLEKAPERRPAGAAALARELDRWLATGGTGSRGRSSATSLLVGLSLLLLGVIAAALVLTRRGGSSTVAVPTSATPPPRTPASADPVGQIDALLAADRLDEARTSAEAHLGRAPGDERVRGLHGLALVLLGRRREALADLERGLVAAPDDARIRAALALARIAALDPKAGLEEAERALLRDADLVLAHLARAEALLALGERDQAEAACSRALELGGGQRPAVLALRARAREDRGDPRGGLEDLDAALVADPGQPEWLVLRAGLRFRAGRVDEALADLDRASQRAPDDPVALLLRCEVLIQLDREDQALEVASGVVARHPSSAAAQAMRGLALAALARHAEAEAALDLAIRLDPTSSQPWLERGRLRALRGALEDARHDLDRAAALAGEDAQAKPRLAVILAARAEVRRGQRDEAGAVQDIRAAIELARDHPDVVGSAARVLGLLKLDEEAAPFLDRSVELAPRSANLRAIRSGSLMRRGQFGRAKEDLDVVLELAPGKPDMWEARAMLRRWMCDFAGAISDATRALELDPSLTRVYAIRGLSRLQLDDLTGAAQDGAAALRHAPEVPDTYLLVGGLAMRRRAWREAIVAYDRSLAMVPDQTEALLERGLAKRMVEDGKGARADFDRAVTLAPDSPRARFLRGRDAVDWEQDLRAAQQDLERACELDPTKPDAWLYLGVAKDRLGDAPGALADYGRSLELRPHVDAFLQRAALRVRTGDPAGAEEDATQAIERVPDVADGWFYRALARLEREGGDLASAEADALKALELAGTTGLDREQLEMLLAKIRKRRAGE